MKGLFQRERPLFSSFAKRKSTAMLFAGIKFGNEMKLFHASVLVQNSARGAVPLKVRRESRSPHYGYQKYVTNLVVRAHFGLTGSTCLKSS